VDKQKDFKMEKLLNTKEIMNFFNITYPTLLAWIKKGIIKGYKINKRWYFSKDEINRVLRESKVSYRKKRIMPF